MHTCISVTFFFFSNEKGFAKDTPESVMTSSSDATVNEPAAFWTQCRNHIHIQLISPSPKFQNQHDSSKSCTTPGGEKKVKKEFGNQFQKMKRGNGKKPGSGERGVLRPGKEEEVVW
jgi:hypothetical protein